MKALLVITLGLLALAVQSVAQPASGTLEQRLAAAEVPSARRVQEATEQLNATRARIAEERLPLVEGNRQLQQQIVALETELQLLRTEAANAAGQRERLSQESEELRRLFSFVRTQVQERLQQLEPALAPGETQAWGEQLAKMRQNLEARAAAPDLQAESEALDLLIQRVDALVGGHVVPGEALTPGSNTLVTGSFLVLGPETYFRGADGSVTGIARAREGGHATVHALPGWTPEQAAPLFTEGRGSVPLDIMGGKALRLSEARGNWREHLEKGGAIGYIILTLGALAVIIAVWKMVDLRGLKVDEPARVRPILAAVRRSEDAPARAAAQKLRARTRELLATAFEHIERPKSVVEEQLYALILQWRLHHERRLPLLAVIVTASPLLGLLGTVTGMVKTFTLITVFGTGNADKLASGIAEALVTTQLGLTIAIPTLLVHGILSQRVKKRLALLERYAVEFVAAAEVRRREPAPPSVVPSP